MCTAAFDPAIQYNLTWATPEFACKFDYQFNYRLHLLWEPAEDHECNNFEVNGVVEDVFEIGLLTNADHQHKLRQTFGGVHCMCLLVYTIVNSGMTDTTSSRIVNISQLIRRVLEISCIVRTISITYTI